MSSLIHDKKSILSYENGLWNEWNYKVTKYFIFLLHRNYFKIHIENYYIFELIFSNKRKCFSQSFLNQ